MPNLVFIRQFLGLERINIMRKIIIALFIMFFTMGSVFAGPIDPTGIWEADNGESRYEVSLCGDGTQLCAKLIWIRPDVVNERNRVYLNSYVVNGAKRRSDREWRGKISVYGHTVSGSVQSISADRLMVRGCALIIICVKQGLVKIAEK